MAGPFTSFVILGAMRTGSNYLESSLSEVEGITCYGETFNPEFLGRIAATELLGFTREMRDADPLQLLAALREKTEGLAGFRLFQDHDHRVLAAVLDDPACAKIVLARNPLHSFVSLTIAKATGQWALKNEKRRREARVRFDAARFEDYLKANLDFYSGIRRRLQETGQTGFSIDYDELSDVRILNGLIAWLGVAGRIAKPSRETKRQNDPDILERVTNPGDMLTAMARIEFLDPRVRQHADRLPPIGTRSFVAAADAPLVFLPIAGRNTPRVEAWLAALDGVATGDLMRNLTAGAHRLWCSAHPGFRSFTVVSHPAERAHDLFVSEILRGTSAVQARLRKRIGDATGTPMPEPLEEADLASDRHRTLFLAFLEYVRLNLALMTAWPIEPMWATQAAVLAEIAAVRMPDMILRSATLEAELAALATLAGYPAPPVPEADPVVGPALADIYDASVEKAVRAAYDRDYLAFGFDDWGASA